MIAMLVIFFIEFASSRYLARIDEQIMQMQLCETEAQETFIQPLTSYLSHQHVVLGGKRVDISTAIAGEAAERAAEAIILNPATVDEESPLLPQQQQQYVTAEQYTRQENGDVGVDRESRKTDSRGRRDSHCGHHHYDPPPVDGSGCPDVTRQSQLLAVGIMEGGLCFHSIFVGLTLAVATGGGFVSLLIAIMFHRMTFYLSPDNG